MSDVVNKRQIFIFFLFFFIFFCLEKPEMKMWCAELVPIPVSVRLANLQDFKTKQKFLFNINK